MPAIAILSGKIDGEVRVANVGTPTKKVAEFRIDTGEGWYTVKAWEGVADRVPPTGSSIIVHGRLSTRSYEKDGRKVYVTEVIASVIDQVGPAAATEPDTLIPD